MLFNGLSIKNSANAGQMDFSWAATGFLDTFALLNLRSDGKNQSSNHRRTLFCP